MCCQELCICEAILPHIPLHSMQRQHGSHTYTVKGQQLARHTQSELHIKHNTNKRLSMCRDCNQNPLRTSFAFAPRRPSHAGAGDAVISMTEKCGEYSPPNDAGNVTQGPRGLGVRIIRCSPSVVRSRCKAFAVGCCCCFRCCGACALGKGGGWHVKERFSVFA